MRGVSRGLPMPVRSWFAAAARPVSDGMDRLAVVRPPSGSRIGRAGFGAVMAVAWLSGLVTPLVEHWHRGQHLQAVVAGVCMAVFGIAIAVAFVVFPQPRWDGALFVVRTVNRWAVLLLCVQGVMSAAMLVLLGGPALMTVTYLAIMSMFVLPARASAQFVITYAVVMVAAPMLVPRWHPGVFPYLLAFIPMVIWGGREIGIRRRVNIELQRRQRAEMAIVEDRNRVARDVHDILGHSLTVITVKTELALRLIDLDPDRAKTEMSDVERLAREALAGVRETVGGLREVSLAGELANVRTALGAAGIEAELPEGDFGGYRPIFGWVLREAVTNVVRHSAATHCAVRVGPSYIEVTDDGKGLRQDAEFGSGLTGLRERVRAEGGALTLAAAPGGGLRLRAEFPE